MTFQKGYFDPDIFKAEQEQVFPSAWIFCGHKSNWKIGEFSKSFTTPNGEVLLLKNQSGQIGAFQNVCRHLGMKLPCKPNGLTQSLTCPYHGWEYDQGGFLKTVPLEENFPGLNKETIRLNPLAFHDAGGFYFINFSKKPEPLPQDFLDPLITNSIPTLRPILRQTFTLNCNWKMVLEQGLEAYHAATAHVTTLSQHMDFDQIKAQYFGSHILNTYPMSVAPLAKLSGVFPASQTVFHRFTFFPFTMISLPVPGHHCSVTMVHPLAPEKTKISFDFYFHTPPLNPKFQFAARLACQRSLKIFKEDLELLEPRQDALRNYSNPLIGFGKMEKSAQYFHETLEKIIEPNKPQS